MNLILLGGPGAGKGTQAKKIISQYDIPQISTGDILRQAVKDETAMGMEAKKYMDDGKLVPDDVIVGIIEDRLSKDDCKKGFILDGFPRTIPQAESLNRVLEDLEKELTAVISFEVSDEELVSRLTGRRVCKECGTSYHVKFNPPEKEGVCDECGGQLITRKDDNKETAKNRIEVYKKQTSPLINYYKKENKLYEVNGERGIEKITEEIFDILEKA
ncbi:MAG: adenylate kinase [Fusobacteriota bacterium]